MPKIKVFVVDDSAFMRGIITKMLESDDEIEVIGSARNGQEAIERIGELKPDVVTLDIEMPVMNGVETTRYIRQNFPFPLKSIPIIALTAHNPADFFEDFHNTGFNYLLTKPYSIERIQKAIDETLKQEKQQN